MWAIGASNHIGSEKLETMIHARPVLAASLLGCALSISIGAGPALGQPEEKRVELIVSMPRSSLPFSLRRLVYDAINKRSGATTRQALPLTKSEMWSVPQENVETVRKVAAQYGVGVHQLDADWNHVFRSSPANMSMNAQQKAMLAQAESSKATMGVGMMLPLRGPRVEYALTKGAGVQQLPTSRRRSNSNSTRKRFSQSRAPAST